MCSNRRKGMVRCMDCRYLKARYCPVTAAIVAPTPFRMCKFFHREVIPNKTAEKEGK